MILALAAFTALAVEPGAEPAPPRARYQMLVASWERAHGNDEAAAAAAQTAMLHAPNAAAPRVFLAALEADKPGTVPERLRLLEAAVRDVGASAAAYTALGEVRAANGDTEGAVAAFTEAEARGGSDPNYVAWIGALRSASAMWPTVAGRDALARWRAAGGPGMGFYAPYGEAVLMSSTRESRAEACRLWRLGTAAGERVEPGRVVDVCLVDGYSESTTMTLFNLRDHGVNVEEAMARVNAVPPRNYGGPETGPEPSLGFAAPESPALSALVEWVLKVDGTNGMPLAALVQMEGVVRDLMRRDPSNPQYLALLDELHRRSGWSGADAAGGHK